MLPIRRVPITANNTTFDCYMTGTHGPWVIFLHGFPDNSASMLALMRELAVHGYRCLAPSMRGYGGSTPVDEDPRFLIGDLGADAIALAHAVSDTPVHLVGHDWGAIATYAAANLSPESLASIVTMAVPPMRTCNQNILQNLGQLRNSWYIGYFQLPGIPEQTLPENDFEWIRELWQAWSPEWEIPKRRVDSVVETLSSGHTLQHALAYYRSLVPFRNNVGLGPWLASWGLVFRPIQVPGLVLCGQKDGCMKPGMFHGTEKAFEVEGELHRVEDAGHFMHLEQHDEVSAAIRRWVKAHPMNMA